MIQAGTVGIIGATIPCFSPIESNQGFTLFWLALSLVSFAAAFFFARRQALKDSEPFWSSPTRRVTNALLPSFLTGLCVGLFVACFGNSLPNISWLLAGLWTTLYGFALHSAGFFMQRGIKVFGWIFVLGGTLTLCGLALQPDLQSTTSAHYAMGAFFGVLHLTYGVYLYFTEKRQKSS